MLSRSVTSFDPRAISRAVVPDGSTVRRRRGQPAKARGPFAGLLASPCGVWLRLDVDTRGEGWRVLLRGATMRGVFGDSL